MFFSTGGFSSKMYLHCGVSKSYVRVREVTVLTVHLICVSSMRDVVMLYPNMSHCLWCIVNIRIILATPWMKLWYFRVICAYI